LSLSKCRQSIATYKSEFIWRFALHKILLFKQKTFGKLRVTSNFGIIKNTSEGLGIVVGAAALKHQQRANSPLERWSQTGVDNQPEAYQYFHSQNSSECQ
jgi:hypothetical protein